MEASNNQKLREALKKCVNELAPFCNGGCRRDEVLEEAETALSEPPRNCDVATEAEAIESLQQTIPLDGLSENDINIVTACIKDIVGALYAPYKEGETE